MMGATVTGGLESLIYIIESANAFRLNAPQTEFIRRCVAHGDSLVASSRNNLLDVDLDRLVTDEIQVDEMRRFLASLRQCVGEQSRVELPDRRVVILPARTGGPVLGGHPNRASLTDLDLPGTPV
jgi:hypothetical protein